MNIALISSWHVHTKKFMEKIINKGVRCLYVWDFDATLGQAAAKEYQAIFEPDYRAILADEQVDAVIIEAPTTMHKELIILAARAKKHIFSDKALALTTEDCLEIEAAVRENDVKFMLSLESFAVNSYEYAFKKVNDGSLGQITSAYFRRSHGAVIRQDLPDYWFDKAQSGGGATLDLGCHGFALLPLICGQPKAVTCLMNEQFGSGVDEYSTTLLSFENGAIGTATTSFVGPTLDNYLEIIGTQGSLQIVGNEHEEQTIFLQSNLEEGYHKKTIVSDADIRKYNPFPIELFVELVEASTEKEIPRYGIEAAKRLTRIIECAYESAETGKTVAY